MRSDSPLALDRRYPYPAVFASVALVALGVGCSPGDGGPDAESDTAATDAGEDTNGEMACTLSCEAGYTCSNGKAYRVHGGSIPCDQGPCPNWQESVASSPDGTCPNGCRVEDQFHPTHTWQTVCADGDVVRDTGSPPRPDTRMDTSADAGNTGDAGEPINPLEGAGDAELVSEGFQFLEGPRWIPDEGVLRFTDIPADTIYELTPPDGIEEWQTSSGHANGLAVDRQGRLLAAEHGGRRVAVYTDGSADTLVDNFQGDRFNSPNDLAVRSDGLVYITDPPYGLGNRSREIAFNGLYRYAPGSDALNVEWRGDPDASRPNGVVLSPDESRLYLADTSTDDVIAFDVADDGSLSNERDFADVPNPDGMAVDTAGNLYVTGSNGVAVLAPDGSEWGTLAVDRTPANCAFGGPDARTLYITARQGLYRIDLPVRGLY